MAGSMQKAAPVSGTIFEEEEDTEDYDPDAPLAQRVDARPQRFISNVRSSKTMRQMETDDEGAIPAHECGKAFVFQRDHTCMRLWNMILVVLLVYVGTIFLFRFCFMAFHIDEQGIDPLGENDKRWKVCDNVVDALFWFDLFFNFFFAYEDENGYEVLNMRLIAKRYLLGLFWLDFLACLPEEAVREIVNLLFDEGPRPVKDLGVTRIYRLQRVSRLARLARLSRLAKLANFNNKIPYWETMKRMRGVRVMNVTCSLLFTCHLLACGWYLIAAFHGLLHDDVTVTWVGQRKMVVNGEEKTLLSAPPFEQWVVAMYFVLTVFTTVGFGDISANTEAEILFAVLTMLVGVIVYSIIISEVIQVVISIDRMDEFIEKQISLFDAYALHVGLKAETVTAIRGDLKNRSREFLDTRFDKEEMKSLLLSKCMPRQLIGKLPTGLYRGKLCQNSFLQCCSAFPMPPRLPSLLAICLLPVRFMRGEVVFQIHDFAFQLNMVLEGTFAYVGRHMHGGGIDAPVPLDDDDNDHLAIPQGEEADKTHSLSMFVSRIIPPKPTTRCSTPSSPNLIFPYKFFGPRTYFGDFECLKGSMRQATMRCESRGTTLLLKKRDLFELIEEFPQFGHFWAAAAGRREWLRRRALSRLRPSQSYRDFAANVIQQAFRRMRQKGVIAPDSEQQERSELVSFTPASVVSTSGQMWPSHSRGMLSGSIAVSEQSLSVFKDDINKMNGRIRNLQAEMQKQSADIIAIKESLRARLHKESLHARLPEERASGHYMTI